MIVRVNGNEWVRDDPADTSKFKKKKKQYDAYIVYVKNDQFKTIEICTPPKDHPTTAIYVATEATSNQQPVPFTTRHNVELHSYDAIVEFVGDCDLNNVIAMYTWLRSDWRNLGR